MLSGALSSRVSAVVPRTVAIVFALGLLAGSVRLLPWFWADGVPLSLTAPFARELAVTIAEVALLVGVPLGFSIAASSFVEKGEARALFALGASPQRLLRSAVLPALLAGALLAAIASVPRASPGRLATALVAQARESCRKSSVRRAVTVPMAGVTWLCGPREKPRVVGRVPALSAQWWFSAASLQTSPDLTEARLTQLRLSAPPGPLGAMNVAASSATLRGLPKWGRARGLPIGWRAALLGVSVVVLAIFVAERVLRSRVQSRVAASALSLTGSIALVGVLRSVEGASIAPPIAALLWPLSLAAPAALFAVYNRVLRGRTR